MIREARLLFLVALTYLIYAASMFLDKGGILFPFPLNEAILLIVHCNLPIGIGRSNLVLST